MSLVAAARTCLALVATLSYLDIDTDHGSSHALLARPAALSAPTFGSGVVTSKAPSSQAGTAEQESPRSFSASSKSVNITGVQCSAVRLRNATIDFTTRRVGFGADAAFVNCTVSLDVATLQPASPVAKGHVDLVLKAPKLQAWVALSTPRDSCLATSAAVTECDCGLDVQELAATFPGHPGTAIVVDIALGAIRSIINTDGPRLFCKLVGPGLVHAVLNHTAPPPLPVPPIAPWATPLNEGALTSALATVVGSLPALGPLRLGMAFAGDDSQAMVVNATAASTINISHTFPGMAHGPDGRSAGLALHLLVPHSTRLSVAIAMNATCDRTEDYAECVVPIGQAAVLNVRAVHAGEADHFLDTVVARLIEDGVDALMDHHTLDGGNVTVLRIPLEGSPLLPPWWASSGLLMFTVLMAVAAAVATHRRFRGKVLRHLHTRRLISLKEKVATDTAIVFVAVALLCGNVMMMSTLGVQTRVGGLPIHRISTTESIRVSWNNGVYGMAIVTALFAMAYPILKGLCIMFFAVVLQRPNSRVLQVLDLCGKMVLVNKYTVSMTADAMTVQGVLTTHEPIHGLTATTIFLSTLIFGCCVSYAPPAVVVSDAALDEALLNADYEGGADSDEEQQTITGDVRCIGDAKGSSGAPSVCHDDDVHGVEDGSAGQKAAAQVCRTLRAIRTHAGRVVFGTTGDVPCGLEVLRVPKDQGRPWEAALRPVVGAPLLVLFSVALGCALTYPTITIHRRGLLTLVLGESTGYSIVDMFKGDTPLLTAELYLATCVGPLLFAMGYARTRFMASFCALDTFVVAGLTGLLQLDRMVNGFLGPNAGAILWVRASFEWPFALICVAAIAQIAATYAMARHRSLTP